MRIYWPRKYYWGITVPDWRPLHSPKSLFYTTLISLSANFEHTPSEQDMHTPHTKIIFWIPLLSRENLLFLRTLFQKTDMHRGRQCRLGTSKKNFGSDLDRIGRLKKILDRIDWLKKKLDRIGKPIRFRSKCTDPCWKYHFFSKYLKKNKNSSYQCLPEINKFVTWNRFSKTHSLNQ